MITTINAKTAKVAKRMFFSAGLASSALNVLKGIAT
jgi:hypothetical protein